MKDVQDVLFALIETLDANTIPYAVMGGLAVRVYALPRPTQDVDLTISFRPDQSLQFLEIVERAENDVSGQPPSLPRKLVHLELVFRN